jgi:hypothetical protein
MVCSRVSDQVQSTSDHCMSPQRAPVAPQQAVSSARHHSDGIDTGRCYQRLDTEALRWQSLVGDTEKRLRGRAHQPEARPNVASAQETANYLTACYSQGPVCSASAPALDHFKLGFDFRSCSYGVNCLHLSCSDSLTCSGGQPARMRTPGTP